MGTLKRPKLGQNYGTKSNPKIRVPRAPVTLKNGPGYRPPPPPVYPVQLEVSLDFGIPFIHMSYGKN